MKTDLSVSGRVELTHHDISKAIIEYLAENYNYKVSKIVYPGLTQPIAIAEISGAVTEQERVQSYNLKIKQTRESAEGFRKENIGVFETIRSFLNDYFIKNDSKETLVEYEILAKDVLDLHPKMDHEKLKAYLHDTRQFPNTEWSTKTNRIVVRSIINH